jgi:hypothetical protein
VPGYFHQIKETLSHIFSRCLKGLKRQCLYTQSSAQDQLKDFLRNGRNWPNLIFELPLRQDPRSTFLVDFLYHEPTWFRKVHIKIFLMRVKLYFESTTNWSWSCSNMAIFWLVTGYNLTFKVIRSNLSCNSRNRVFRPRLPWSIQLECCVKPVKVTKTCFFSCLEKLSLIMIVLTAPIIVME